MRKIGSLFIFFIVISFIYCQEIDYVWSQQIGGEFDDEGSCVAVDSFNNYYAAGWFEESMTIGSTNLIGNGDDDIYLAKFNENGSLIWVKGIGGSSIDKASGIAIDNDNNIILSGEFSGEVYFDDNIVLTSSGVRDAFLAKFDGAGNLVWVKQAGGNGFDAGYGVEVDSEQNIIFTGRFFGIATFDDISVIGNGSWDVFIAKYNSSGEILWAKGAGGSSFDRGRNLTIDNQDNIYLTGSFIGTATFDPIIISSNGETDIFLAKYDNDGDPIWVTSAGGMQFDQGWSVCCDDFNNVYLTGYFEATANFGNEQIISNGSSDIFLAKYDSAGNLNWVDGMGDTGNDQGRDVKFDSNDQLLLTGYFQGEVAFGDITLFHNGMLDMFIASHNGDDQYNWAINIGAENDEMINKLAIDNDNNFVFTGKFWNHTIIGTTILTAQGIDNYESFLSKIQVNTTYSDENNILKNSIHLSNYPNPFNPSTKINFCLTTKSKDKVEIEIFNIKGQNIRTLECIDCVDALSSQMMHSIIWNGKDKNGKTVSSGVYYYRLKIGDHHKTKKMLMLK